MNKPNIDKFTGEVDGEESWIKPQRDSWSKMKNSCVIIVTRLKAPDESLVYKYIPPNVETIFVFGGIGSNGRCKNLGASRAHKPILIFMDDNVVFNATILQRQIDKVKTDPNLIITLGWREWEAPRVLITHRETFNKIKFDPNLHLLESLDFLLRAQQKGFTIDAPTSPYDGQFAQKLQIIHDEWFWYQFNQVAFILKHKHIPRNAFNPYQKTIIIKPLLFFFNPTTEKGIPTLFKSRRLLCRWMGALYYGIRKLWK